MGELLGDYGDAAMTAIGFFWKAGWAFVLGYAVSAMIQVFVPRARLAPKMGDAAPSSVSLATIFGMISSSCSFAALAAARSLVLKGAHLVAATAFMFASTNLVIELGILILIFLGWQFLVAEIIGGLLLIAISSVLVRLTYPRTWMEAAREKVEEEAGEEEADFDWRKRIRSVEGWQRVGMRFAMEWRMVWKEILVGFTVAGFVAVFVPASVWRAIFLADAAEAGGFLVVLENAAVAPFVASATFIGSMGNIPLATVLNSGGVLFAGIMGFIYSDLMVPPLVKVNARYYGWRLALYIAAVMYVSIVTTAIILHYAFAWTGLTPESSRAVEEITRFRIDYTFFMNIGAVVVAAVMLLLRRARKKAMEEDGGDDHDHGGGGIGVQAVVTWIAIALLAGGLVVKAVTA